MVLLPVPNWRRKGIKYQRLHVASSKRLQKCDDKLDLVICKSERPDQWIKLWVYETALVVEFNNFILPPFNNKFLYSFPLEFGRRLFVSKIKPQKAIGEGGRMRFIEERIRDRY
jgi:hypothetical protein